jgi:hypothetical protein
MPELWARKSPGQGSAHHHLARVGHTISPDNGPRFTRVAWTPGQYCPVGSTLHSLLHVLPQRLTRCCIVHENAVGLHGITVFVHDDQ